MESRAALEAEAAALLELDSRKKRSPLYFYTPTPKGRLLHESRAKTRIMSGGNRSSKTETGTAEDGAYLLGYRPWVLRELGLPEPDKPWVRPDNLPPEALCFDNAGVRVRVPGDHHIITGLPTKKGILEALWPKFKHYLGPYIQDVKLGHGGAPAKITLKNGSQAFFSSSEQDVMSFESTNYTSIHIDEPIPRNIWTGIKRSTVDQLAPIWMTFTPIGPCAPWIFHDLITIADGTKIFKVEASIYDNPFLSKEAIAELADDPVMTEAEREARLYGRFVLLSDRIYPTFDERVHVVNPFEPPAHWTIGMVTDPHQVRPWFIAYFAVNPRGAITFFREWPAQPFHKIRKDHRSMEEYAMLMRQLDSKRNVSIRLIDPNMGPRKETIRGIYIPSLVDEMARYGLHFFHRINDNLEYGEGMVRRLLSYDSKQPISAVNMPRLFFTSDCPNLISSMLYYTAKNKPGAIDDPDETKRDETFKDGADVVRYVAVSGIAESALMDTFDPFDDDYPEDDTNTYND